MTEIRLITHINFSFDFLGVDNINFENNISVNELARWIVLTAIKTLAICVVSSVKRSAAPRF